MMLRKLQVLIIGHGFVGKAVDYGFTHPRVEKTIVDPKYPDSPKLEDIHVGRYDLIFVCVPTPFGDSGSIDATILLGVMKKLRGSKIHDNVIAIKSTVTPDILSKIALVSGVVYNPEFLTEKSANEQFINPPFHIMGGAYNDTQRLASMYSQYSLCAPCEVLEMTLEEASFVKYTINSFLATKVTFFNQIYDAAVAAGVNFSTIINAVGRDTRVGHSHTRVPGFDGKQGYGGACFPKDTAAFTKYSNKLTLLEKAITINNQYRSNYERDEREIEQNIIYKDKQ